MSHFKDFYLNKTPNPLGLYLKDMWNFTDWEFDHTHDFIQWMFPLEVKSKHSELAPVINIEDLSEMLDDKQVINNLLRSLYFAENNWGFDVRHKRIDRLRPPSFRLFHEQNWPAINHHNYIRISRVLYCLKLFHQNREAQELMNYLENNLYSIYENVVGGETLDSWRLAYNHESLLLNAS